MCDPVVATVASTIATAAGAAMSMAGQAQQARAQRNASTYRAAVARNNAQVAQWQADDAIQRGKIEEQRHRDQVNRLKGRQVATMAASGVEVTSGSALETLGDTAAMGELDALQIRDNAEREAWQFRNQATQHQAESGLHAMNASSTPGMSLGPVLAAGGQIADRWYQYSLEE